MRILLMSNAGWEHSGYGVQVKELAPRLQEAGHDIAVFSFHGLEGGIIEWQGIKHYPKGYVPYGSDVVPLYARDFGADIVISLIDIWVLDPQISDKVRWCPWSPVDSQPVPDEVVMRHQRAFANLAYSRFAERSLKEAGVRDVLYVPHGVNRQVFKPKDQQATRQKFDIPREAFVVGMVAANQSFPSRKAFEENFEAFAIFAEQHDDARLYVHSWVSEEMKGVNLTRLAHMFNIEHKVIFTNQYRYHLGLSEEDMCDLYNVFDVLLAVSRAEGFGIPCVEAQACGKPVITINFAASPELTASGWVVEPAAWLMNRLYVFQAMPDVDGIVARLEEAYNMDQEAEKEKALALAKQYDYDYVFQEYWQPALSHIEQKMRRRRVTH